MRRLGARTGAVAAVLGIVGALTACSLFSQAPADVTGAVDDAVNEIRGIVGVEGVSSLISQRESSESEMSKSSNPSWRASIIIEVEPNLDDLGRLAAEVEAVLAVADEQVPTGGTVHVPADRGGIPGAMTLASSDHWDEIVPPEELAASLEMLRDLDGAEGVSVSQGNPVARVHISEPSLWPGVAAQLRKLPDLGFGALTAVSIDIPTVSTHESGRQVSELKINAASPNAALIPILAELASSQDVVSVSYDGTKTVAMSTDAPLMRPSLLVKAEGKPAVERITTLLTGLDDGMTSVPGVGRAAFDVLEIAGSAGDSEGFIGLPLGSPEPDDLTEAPTAEELASGPPSVILDAGAADGRVATDRAAVGSFMDAAGDIAGIRGTADVGFSACEPGFGERAEGEVVIPIFEIADRADSAYAAITDAWVADGYVRVDRAMGVDMYAAADPRSPGVTSVSIRGTAEGILIRASSVCVVTRY